MSICPLLYAQSTKPAVTLLSYLDTRHIYFVLRSSFTDGKIREGDISGVWYSSRYFSNSVLIIGQYPQQRGKGRIILGGRAVFLADTTLSLCSHSLVY